MTEQRSAFSLPLVGSIDENIELAELGEQLGYQDVWLADTGGTDVFVLAALIGARTTTLRVGTAVVPVFTRPPAVLASAAATVSQVAGPDRFILGIGASSPAIVEDWCGIPYRRPLTRVRETVMCLRQMFTEPKVSFTGDTITVKNYRLSPVPAGPIPIWVAAQRAGMATMAGELADGVATNYIPASYIPHFKKTVAEGAAVSGRSDELPLVVRLPTLLTDDRSAGYEQLRAGFGPYLATPTYNSFLASCGYETEAAAIKAGWDNRDRAAVAAAVTDELIEDLAVVGNEAQCRDRLDVFRSAGVDIAMIHPVVRHKDEAALVLRVLAPADPARLT